ncbi:hypothetical protein AB733_11480 [Photobacterium swingsii]|uniref:DUF2970 domain-containing protein n=2 Tax=Photobacterium swingsii TaxID=680026 RepID=A0A0J8VDG9_9GAMM|nr:DUF2970 domain-containing protein [Photobacterium swingsii]KMV30570.1 hypothetical protein AB733_11480 [Photobacterium swingsii]PSW23843.1 DUF2970 domain-containing protein [Photobacterium swingsii]
MAKQDKPPMTKAFLSAVAALFGVQSDKNRQQDFAQSSPWPFILAGIIVLGCFVGFLLGVTWLVTHLEMV